MILPTYLIDVFLPRSKVAVSGCGLWTEATDGDRWPGARGLQATFTEAGQARFDKATARERSAVAVTRVLD